MIVTRTAIVGLLFTALAAAVPFGNARVERIDAVPARMNLQGFLTDAGGNPIQGTKSLGFRIYAGTALLWQETQSCLIRAGLFSAELGAVNPLPDSVFRAGTSRELELVVEGQALTPKVNLISTGFAFRAGAVERPFSPGLATDEIADAAVTMAKLNSSGASLGQVIKWTGSGWQPRPDSAGGPPTGIAGGDLYGSYPNPEVVKLRGRDIENTYPATGDLLTYRNSRWELELPAGDVDGEIWDLTVTGLQGRPVYDAYPYTGEVLAWTGSRWEPREPGGDIEGYIYDATVTGLQGRAVSTSSPSTGNVLTWYSGQWTPRPPAGQEWRETFGTVKLSNGFARVALDPDFLDLVAIAPDQPFRIFLQQVSEGPVQVVVEKAASWFLVRGPEGSNAEFDYRVVARAR